MNVKYRLVIILSLLSVSAELFSQRGEKPQPIKSIKEFVTALRNDDFTNEDIVATYMSSCCYFSVDTVRGFADECIDLFRDSVVKKMEEKNVEVLKYAEVKAEFMVPGHKDKAPLSPAELQPLRFYLDTPGRNRFEITDTDHIYVIRDRSDTEGAVFVLLDENAKIISFMSLSKDNRVGMWGW